MSTRYAVREIFLTLQGEGARAGTKAVFLRLAGCNLWNGRPEDRNKGRGACARWCDTDFFKGTPMTALEIRERLDALWPVPKPYDRLDGEERWVVVTGGEPTLQLDRELLRVLREGWFVAVETNGSNDPVENGTRVLQSTDWITVSPKLGAPLVLGQADEVKVVLPGDVRGQPGWTDEALSKLEDSVFAEHYFVQPQDVVFDGAVGDTLLHPAQAHTPAQVQDAGMEHQENVNRCVAWVLKHPMWKLSAQLHKYVKLP